ncbi:MAG: tryptophan synthase subunit alpha [Bacteroidales bacterium]|nr:tryptophan synthase subunit alpha [Bacteroidales bacterium]
MNRIDQLFQQKKEGILSIYMTAGFPELDDTVEVMKAVQEGGADMIELGMPFSDPLADGEVIQQSSQTALRNGMNIRYLFEQIRGIRKHLHIPLVMMGYLNPVLQFGFERFIEKCAETGIDGLILPDLPLDVYEEEYRTIVERSGLKFIMLITPYTLGERIHQIAEASGGFMYMVADSSTTGARSGISSSQLEYFRKIDAMNLSIPRLIGFGISSHETFRKACEHASGAIIGSAFIRAIGDDNKVSVSEKAKAFVQTILNGSGNSAG